MSASLLCPQVESVVVRRSVGSNTGSYDHAITPNAASLHSQPEKAETEKRNIFIQRFEHNRQKESQSQCGSSPYI
jgi:hypothetical protein